MIFLFCKHDELFKSDIKDIYNVTKVYISNKCCSCQLSVHQNNLEKQNVSRFPQKYEADQLFSTLIIIIEFSGAEYYKVF